MLKSKPWLRFSVDEEQTADEIPTIWVTAQDLKPLCEVLRSKLKQPFDFLFDLTAIDETTRQHKVIPHRRDFTVVYLLRSYARNQDLRIKVALTEDAKEVASVSSIWPNANWYEREVWDLFGVKFTDHPCLRRIMMPTTWQGHPLCKTHPARATEMGEYSLPDDLRDLEQEALKFNPADWGLKPQGNPEEFMWLNLGPNHPSVHGVFRIMLQLDGEEIVRSHSGYRLPPSRCRKNGRTPKLAFLYSLHRSH